MKLEAGDCGASPAAMARIAHCSDLHRSDFSSDASTVPVGGGKGGHAGLGREWKGEGEAEG